MQPFLLGDIYIGDYMQSQAFNARPAIYSARYGLRGHNGIDIACPSLTPIISAADGWIKEIGSKELGTYDSAGYGNYIKVVHNGYFTIYAHLNDVAVKIGQKVVAGQLLGHSNNTGFSDNPHLHFGVAPCDENGNKTEKDNGWSGYIDPNGPRCSWNIKNIKAPILPNATTPVDAKVSILQTDFDRMRDEGSGYRTIVEFLLKNRLNDYLASVNERQISLDLDKHDPINGERVKKYLVAMVEEIGEMNEEIKALQEQLREAKTQPVVPVTPVTVPVNPEAAVDQLTPEQKTSILKSWLKALSDFAFVVKK